MLGSYGPKKESQFAMTPLQQAPSGMLARGHYTVKSKFVDDDNETHLEWEWYAELLLLFDNCDEDDDDVALFSLLFYFIHLFICGTFFCVFFCFCRSFDLKKDWS